jgi:hypothetical protein
VQLFDPQTPHFGISREYLSALKKGVFWGDFRNPIGKPACDKLMRGRVSHWTPKMGVFVQKWGVLDTFWTPKMGVFWTLFDTPQTPKNGVKK